MKSWEYYNKIAKEYDEMYEDSYWQMHNAVSEKIIFNNIDISNGKLLDIGAGTGFWSKIFLDNGFDVYALEPAENMVNMLKERFKKTNLKVFKGIGENLPFENSSFDIIIAMGDVLSYSEDINLFISEVYRVLKKDGIFIGTVDNLNKFILDAFFSKEFGIIKSMEKFKTAKVGVSNIMSFKSNLFTYDSLYNLLHKKFKKVDIFSIMPFTWEFNEDFSKYWADVLELELHFSKSFYDTAEHLLYMVVK
ncbi:hypothetical protein XO10_01840 [Marinitoga sp. 1135]|uniref:Methylase involved in ubiquinone/menaquinone biosynthesis n=1 Tax=Marinitoga piezophila (strain DSM 14283 / JCM 11233 / KA3) TaxID=443254 RepID=H2J4E9_MARPK|nr:MULTISPECIES: class I SAM-dependent methyltransferase [Marinitoga]AEX84804.1 methylase involved in ubiquinone/menaquinone biosynthesis [Marinitoga piezophila KA3]NUU95048.1 hypothetical protein [Marinitoga sp. 1135]